MTAIYSVKALRFSFTYICTCCSDNRDVYNSEDLYFTHISAYKMFDIFSLKIYSYIIPARYFILHSVKVICWNSKTLRSLYRVLSNSVLKCNMKRKRVDTEWKKKYFRQEHKFSSCYKKLIHPNRRTNLSKSSFSTPQATTYV